MIDWHSHILPGMDDGSRDVAESIALIGMQASQGVSTVVATPHFYANDGSAEAFLDRRQKAFEQLVAELPEGSPEIKLGAEVRYYQGISKMSGLKDLRTEGSRVLLLEMPMGRWTEYTMREIIELSGVPGIQLVLAHIERYLHQQRPAQWERLYENGILAQVNAGYFVSPFTRRKALSLLQTGGIHFIGSDCHNTVARTPQIGKAFAIIQKKLGHDYISQMNEYGYSVLVK